MMGWGRHHWGHSSLLLLQETGYWDGTEAIGATVAFCYYRRLDTGMGSTPLELQYIIL